MRDRWSDEEAAKAVEVWGKPFGEAVALRVYTSRLIGADGALVLHGGGNTSVKHEVVDLLGEVVPALFVKGSGWDLAHIEPAGLPAVDLRFLRRMRDLEFLSDEDMVNAQRTHLFDASSPNPSVETLLHAFLPHAFVDHTHADAIIAITNTDGGEAVVREALGDDVAIVPYVMAGFELSRVASEIYEANPNCIGLVLMQHGLFTFGATAEESYRRHIEVVRRAEAYLERHGATVPRSTVDPEVAARRAAALAPVLRGALGRARGADHWVLDYRGDASVRGVLDGVDGAHHALSGPLTPDHVLRTKRLPLYIELDLDAGPEIWRQELEPAIRAFGAAVDAEFEACAQAAGGVEAYTRLDNTPRVVMVPGVGLFGVGTTPKAARIAADIAEHTLVTKARSAAIGSWNSLSPQQLFEMEYWSLEQAKLGRKAVAPLQGRIAVITGGAGAIGVGVARELRSAGALVALLDRDSEGLQQAVQVLGDGEDLMTVQADVTEALDAALAKVALRWGGLDLLVVNAGIADQGQVGEMSDDRWERVLEVNLGGAWRSLGAAVRVLKQQSLGGDVVMISSKNVLAPGAGFAAYSASKAGAHQLARVAALELAEHNVRVNLVTPDAVFSEGEVPSGLWQTVGPDRAASRGLSMEELPEFYRQRNLLKAQVTGADVGRAVVFFATRQTPTTGAVLPVDGGVPGAFPR